MDGSIRIPIAYKHVSGDVVKVAWWDSSMPFPALGKEVGIDTETELITDAVRDPPVVVLGCFDPQSMTCWQVMWQHIPAFMRELAQRSVVQYYFNCGFDQQVIDNEDQDFMPVLTALDRRRVVDAAIRLKLHDLATVGDIRYQTASLAGAAWQLEHVKLDKGDGSEDSDRLSFRRGVPVTESQRVYLAHDCISTLAVAVAIGPQPTEIECTQGAVVLSNIESNGMFADLKVAEALRSRLTAEMTEAADKLRAMGFPLKEDADRAKLRRSNAIAAVATRLVGLGRPGELATEMVRKPRLVKRMLCILDRADTAEDIRREAGYIGPDAGAADLSADEKRRYAEIEDETGIAPVMGRKGTLMLELIAGMLKRLMETPEWPAGRRPLRAALEEAMGDIDPDEYAPAKEDAPEPVGPQKFLQSHMEGLIGRFPALSPDNPAKPVTMLDTTKGGKLKLAKTDMWKLADLGIEDEFLKAYTTYKHAEKMISTYLKPEYISSDGRVHPHFNSIVRTGRTSCSSPNLQNIPARDARYPLRNMFRAPEGMYLVSTDFNFIELVSFAESCIRRFGFSVMGDIINADVDPHYWFAGVRAGYVSGDVSFTADPKEVERMRALLSEKVSKKQRQDAKAANRNWPFKE